MNARIQKILINAAVVLIILLLLFLIWITAARAALSTGHYELAEKLYRPFRGEQYYESIYDRGEEFFAGGDYESAMKAFGSLAEADYGDWELKTLDCRFRLARSEFDRGDCASAYEYLSPDKIPPVELRPNGWSALYNDCAAGLILQKVEEGDTAAVPEIYGQAVIRQADEAGLEAFQGALYSRAAEYMHGQNFPPAEFLFKLLGSFRHSDERELECRAWRGYPATDESILAGAELMTSEEGGELYHIPFAFVYFPENVDRDTKLLVYFAGGGGESILDACYPMGYVSKYRPNAICLFMAGSGFAYMESYMESTLDYLMMLCRHCNIFPPETVVAGSSNGGYTALQFSCKLEKGMHRPVKSILIFDMGLDWEVSPAGGNLSDEEIKLLKDYGTVIYAFEQKKDLRDFGAVYHMLASGLQVEGISCWNKGHNEITVNGFLKGAMSWGLGECELDPLEYNNKFDEGSKEESDLS
ncbi:MAG: tetratricopeptide repeat protein [Candidatus Limivicinus sp.]